MSKKSSWFADVAVAPPIEAFFMNKLYLADTAPVKVDLSIGAYRTEEGKPWVMPFVREVERRLATDETLNHEYLPALGYEPFCAAATELVLGTDSTAIREGRATGVQCLSGTGSLRAGAEFMAHVLGLKTVYISSPTWCNHNLVFKAAGFETLKTYRYWDAEKLEIDIEGLVADLESASAKSVILLHGCAHNPTGVDPTKAQWKRIAEKCKKKNLFVFFDMAYQGFASADPHGDAWAVRYFVDQMGMELMVAQSFAKNFGLYNERVGNLTVVVSDPAVLPAFKSQMTRVIRGIWSDPPSHGAKIVHMVLTTPDLRQQWFAAIESMTSRIRKMRAALRTGLEKLGTPGTWEHVTQQIGMFCFTDLTPNQVDHMVKHHKVFMLKDGRINICGLNTKNVDYVASAIDETVRTIPAKR